MPLPALLLPLVGGAAAVTAGGAKLSAHLAEKKVKEVMSEINSIDAKARWKKDKFGEERQLASQEFGKRAARYSEELETLASRNPSAQDVWEPEPWLKKRLATFSVRPKFQNEEPQFQEPVAAMQSAAHLLNQGMQMSKSHPVLGKGMALTALAGAAVGYITSQLDYKTKADEFVAKARVHVDACARSLKEFDESFRADLLEDRESAKLMVELVEELEIPLSKDRPELADVENLKLVYRSAVELLSMVA